MPRWCDFGESPIVEAADIVLFTRSILAPDSRISQRLIFDTLYSYVFLHADAASKNAVYNTEYALRKKKY